jgi:hypothetical protein
MTQTITADDLYTAFQDVIGMVGEHEQSSQVAKQLGVDEDAFLKLEADCARFLDQTLSQTVIWPPKSNTERRAGLAFATAFGFLTAICALRERPDA